MTFWEVRATIGNNTFRLLGFFDGPKLIVLTSGFAKKTNKVPKQDIETAEERKRDYFTSWESLRSEPEERTMKKDELEIFIDLKKAESPEFAENFEEGYLNFRIGVILRQAREQMGATQADVAEKLNTTKSVISRMENHAEDIKLSTLAKYAKALGKKVKLEIQ